MTRPHHELFLTLSLAALSSHCVAAADPASREISSDSCDISGFLNQTPEGNICHFITTNCSLSTFNTAHKFYCTDSRWTQTTLFTFSTLVIVIYFLVFALLTQHHLYPNLSLLATHLHISPHIAGLTLLALGNATPDVFSTYSAMSHHSASLALGELVGAANFVICCVVGGMGIVKPFEVDKQRFCWDLGMFSALCALAVFFIGDGKLRNWECVVMVVGYVGYVVYQIVFTNDVTGEEEEDVMDALSVCEDQRSVLSLGESQRKGIQPVGILEAQRIWSRRGSDASLDEETPLLKRPSLERPFKSSEQLRFATEGQEHLVKSASSTHVETLNSTHNLDPPQIMIDDVLLEESEPVSRETDYTYKESAWWVFMLSPMTDDEPQTLITFLVFPLLLALNLLNPVFPSELYSTPEGHMNEIKFKRRLFLVQCLVTPLFFHFTLMEDSTITQTVVFSLCLLLCTAFITPAILIPTMGFPTSILLIVLTSSHLITLLKNMGVMLKIPESLLGLTVLAIGNSTGDLVSNLTLAGLDMGVVGLNACLGAPLLYILFGIGVNGLVINHARGDSFMDLEIMDDNFRVSAAGLLCALAGYAILVPCQKWTIGRGVGCASVCWWCLVTAVNVYISTK